MHDCGGSIGSRLSGGRYVPTDGKMSEKANTRGVAEECHYIDVREAIFLSTRYSDEQLIEV